MSVFEPPAFLSPQGEEIRFRTAWRRDDAALKAQAVAFWSRIPRLPVGVAAAERAEELSVLGYVDGELAAVATARVRALPFLAGARFAMHRMLVARDYRRHGVGRALSVAAKQVLTHWSLAHPDEALMGVGGVVQSIEYLTAPADAPTRRPVYRQTGLTAAAFGENGDLVRIAWFDHARL